MSTIVTGFFDIDREHWPYFTRSLSCYLENAKTNLSLKENMVIFIEEKLSSFVKECRAGLLDRTCIVTMKKEDLPKYSLYHRIKEIMESAEFREGIKYPSVPEMWNPEYIIITWSKTDLIKKAIELDPFHTSHFCWLDFGLGDYAKINHFPTRIHDRIRLLCRSKPLPSDLNRVDMAKSHTNRFAAGFVTGHKDHFLTFIKEVNEEINRFLELNVVDCEQTIYSNVYLQHNDLFELYYGDWDDIIVGYNKN